MSAQVCSKASLFEQIDGATSNPILKTNFPQRDIGCRRARAASLQRLNAHAVAHAHAHGRTLPWGRFPLNEARFVALWLDPLDLGRFTEAVAILAAAAAVGLFSLTDQKSLSLRDRFSKKGSPWSFPSKVNRWPSSILVADL